MSSKPLTPPSLAAREKLFKEKIAQKAQPLGTAPVPTVKPRPVSDPLTKTK